MTHFDFFEEFVKVSAKHFRSSLWTFLPCPSLPGVSEKNSFKKVLPLSIVKEILFHILLSVRLSDNPEAGKRGSSTLK